MVILVSGYCHYEPLYVDDHPKSARNRYAGLNLNTQLERSGRT